MEIKTAYIILADGFEEIEALGTMDVLRRMHCFVHSVGLESKTVRGSHHILVEAAILADFVKIHACTGLVAVLVAARDNDL